MTFKNKLAVPITFELGGVLYSVEANGTVEVPERFVFAIPLMGVPLEDLETATRPTPPAPPVVDPAAPVAPPVPEIAPDAPAVSKRGK